MCPSQLWQWPWLPSGYIQLNPKASFSSLASSSTPLQQPGTDWLCLNNSPSTLSTSMGKSHIMNTFLWGILEFCLKRVDLREIVCILCIVTLWADIIVNLSFFIGKQICEHLQKEWYWVNFTFWTTSIFLDVFKIVSLDHQLLLEQLSKMVTQSQEQKRWETSGNVSEVPGFSH